MMSITSALELPKGYWYESLDSTQEEAKRLVASGQVQGTAYVWSHHQTQGKGTHGRTWDSPAGKGLYLSIIHTAIEGLSPHPLTPLYTQAAGVACIEALLHVLNFDCQLKPINDIYVAGSKLGGILVESDIQAGAIQTLITGIGINTHKGMRQLHQPKAPAISLEEIVDQQQFSVFEPECLVETLVAKVCFWYGLLFQGQNGQIERAWSRYAIWE